MNPTFLLGAIRSPRTVGAIAPSSPRLARRLTAPIPETGDPVVVELGAGTGAVSVAIDRKLAGRGRYLALEADPAMLTALRQRIPHIEAHHADAVELPGLLVRHQIGAADVVVSGLPWALFTTDTQDQLLSQITAALAPHGVFTTFAYLHALGATPARRFRALLHRRFGEVLPTRTVWRNLPPAITYVCRRPHNPRTERSAVWEPIVA